MSIFWKKKISILHRILIMFSIYSTHHMVCFCSQAQKKRCSVLEQVAGHHAEGVPQPVGHYTLWTTVVDQELHAWTVAQLPSIFPALTHLSVILNISRVFYCTHKNNVFIATFYLIISLTHTAYSVVSFQGVSCMSLYHWMSAKLQALLFAGRGNAVWSHGSYLKSTCNLQDCQISPPCYRYFIYML